jgi:multidrug efflux pump subunit AcrA (membrane-fusion protein)
MSERDAYHGSGRNEAERAVTWKKWLAGLLVLAGLGYGASLWLRGPIVATATAQRGDVAEVVYATGAVEPLTWSKVLPLLRARIVEHCRCEGQFVKKGQILAKLDDTAAQAELAQVQTKRDFAESDVKRLANLIATGATTRLTLERAETELRQLDSQIAALRARLTDYLLVAPKEGIVLRADGQVGDIPVTTDVLFWVGQPKPLQVIADVNEEDIAKVKEEIGNLVQKKQEIKEVYYQSKYDYEIENEAVRYSDWLQKQKTYILEQDKRKQERLNARKQALADRPNPYQKELDTCERLIQYCELLKKKVGLGPQTDETIKEEAKQIMN